MGPAQNQFTKFFNFSELMIFCLLNHKNDTNRKYEIEIWNMKRFDKKSSSVCSSVISNIPKLPLKTDFSTQKWSQNSWFWCPMRFFRGLTHIWKAVIVPKRYLIFSLPNCQIFAYLDLRELQFYPRKCTWGFHFFHQCTFIQFLRHPIISIIHIL